MTEKAEQIDHVSTALARQMFDAVQGHTVEQAFTALTHVLATCAIRCCGIPEKAADLVGRMAGMAGQLAIENYARQTAADSAGGPGRPH